MYKRIALLAVLGLMMFGLTSIPTQANFVQCPGGICDGGDGITEEGNLVNGTPLEDEIDGLGGDDVIFGGESPDEISGGGDNDLLFGGPGSDELSGNDGDDTVLPGSDTTDFSQFAGGHDGNDIFHVFVGDTFECLFIDAGPGSDGRQPDRVWPLHRHPPIWSTRF